MDEEPALITPTSGSAAVALMRMGLSAEDVIAAVDIDRVTGHRAGVVACQEDASGAHLLDRNEPSRRSTLRHPFHQRFEIGDAGGGEGSQWARAKRMDANALGPELGRQIAHRRFERRLDWAHDPGIF